MGCFFFLQENVYSLEEERLFPLAREAQYHFGVKNPQHNWNLPRYLHITLQGPIHSQSVPEC